MDLTKLSIRLSDVSYLCSICSLKRNHGWPQRQNIFSLELCSQKAERLLCCPVNLWKDINEHGHFTLNYTFHHSDIHLCETSWICSTVFYFFLGSSIPDWVISRFLWFLRCWSWGSFDFMYNYNWLNTEKHLWNWEKQWKRIGFSQFQS